MKEKLSLDVSDLIPSSDLDNIEDIFSKNPSEAWHPDDEKPTLEIDLPEVNGVPAGKYDIMIVAFKQTGNPVPVTVTILDEDGKVILEVSPE